MLLSIDAALRQNTNHVSSYLLLAAHLIDAEEYGSASNALAKVLAVNPWQAEAWAYRAVLAHLNNDSAAEAEARATALKYWKTNPRVDHLIGLKLSQKYRFAEGSARQRQALQFDPKYLPAKNQLAQDLLRLGDEQEGWALALEVQESDAYNVEAYNLAALHDSLAKFQTLTNQDFILRMSPHEATIYGADVLQLLQRAKTNLCPKYGMELTQPTIVEVFPDQKDFGVRTFGMPGNPGYLGVCFGSVITANSPASQVGHPANWQAVLYHEFCHVVTLSLTHNKMPRWLSEGISVYEERQANPTWGQAMTPRYREMVLGKDFTPVSELSAAFLTPKSEHHLQFAYYESSLVVEFLVTRFGLESLQKILHDLGEGVEIHQAIAAHTAPMETIEKDFAAFARDRAEKLAPDLDLTKPSASEFTRNEPDWMAIRSDNFYVLTRHAKKLLSQKKWEEAKIPLEHLLKLYPANTDTENAYVLLAQAHRHLGETNEERAVLSQLAALDADELDTYLRLMELGSAAQDWPAVAENATRFLAVNPLLAAPYRYLARASEALGHTMEAIHAYRTLLLLDPPDPAEAHFRLARLLYQTGDPGAKRHVLQALEEAPRFRDAHRLLLQMTETNKPTASAAPALDAVQKP
jgi:tetratricopeptide (TPR) repeat protein